MPSLPLDLSGTYAGSISGGGINGDLFAVTGGTEIVSGAINVLSIGTAASAQLVLIGGARLAALYGVTNEGVLDVSAASGGVSVGTLVGTGQVDLGGQTLVITDAGHQTFYTPPQTSNANANSFDGDGDVGVYISDVSLSSIFTYDTYSGTIAGTGGVAITGGMERLTGLNTYSGGTVVNNAVLGVNSDAAMGAASGGLALTNAELVAFGSFSSQRSVILTGTGTIDPNAFTVNFAGPISGGGLAVTGGGLWR